MKIILAGATGFIGKRLIEALLSTKPELTLITRDAGKAARWRDRGVDVRAWSDPAWPKALDGADAVINLAGEGVADARWSRARKEKIINSRVQTTKALVDAMAAAARKPKVLVNASAVGYYGPGDDAVDESALSGEGFLPQVCLAWENEALKAKISGARVVLLRLGVVLGADGGALKRMLLPFKLGLGGRLGSGKQWFPWIHADDVVGLILEALSNPALNGPVNAAAPQAATNADFTQALGRALHRPTVASVPGFALKLLLGEMSDMLLTGQRVYPAAAEKAGYRFKFPALADCLADLLKH